MTSTTASPERQALAIAQQYSGRVAWPTVALVLAASASYLALVVAALQGVVPLWLVVPLLGVLVYVHYTPLHEAVHRNISGQVPGRSWLDPLLGQLVSLPLGISYTMHRAAHFAHHARTNQPGQDPDLVFGSGSVLDVVKGCLLIVPREYSWYLREAWPKASPRERALVVTETGVILAVRVVPALMGFLPEVLLLAVLPALIGVLLTSVFFAWLVHQPNDSTARWTDTTTFVAHNWLHWPITLLWLWQNFHAVHHLFPRVPFFRYHLVFAGIEPVMQAKGSPVVSLAGAAPQTAAAG